MPKIPIRPLVKLSKEQWKELIKRVFSKEAKLTEKAAGEIMGTEPLVTREMGTLTKEIPMGVGESRTVSERLPIEEARAKYFASPSQYSMPRGYEPEAREIASLPPPSTQLGGDEMAKRIAYERLKFKPIIPPSTQSAMRVIGEDIAGPEKETLMRRAGLTMEDIRPGVKPETVLAEKGFQARVEKPPIEVVARAAQAADQLWKGIGGARSAEGKRWNDFLEGARGSVKRHFDSGRDYFISSFYRWYQDPKSFSKSFPRESKIFNDIQRDSKFKDVFAFLEAGVE